MNQHAHNIVLTEAGQVAVHCGDHIQTLNDIKDSTVKLANGGYLRMIYENKKGESHREASFSVTIFNGESYDCGDGLIILNDEGELKAYKRV